MRSLLVLPTAERVREALSELHKRHASVFGVRVIAIADFEKQLVSSVASTGRRPLPRGARSLALRSLLGSDAATGFGPAANRPGFRRALEAVLIELSSGGATPEELASAADRVPAWLRQRATALARIARDYQRFLGYRELDDPDFAMSRVAAQLERGEALPPLLQDVTRVEILDVVDWPPARLGLIRALASALKRHDGNVVVQLPHSEHPILAEAIDPVFRALEAMAGDIELRTRPFHLPAPERCAQVTAATSASEAREVARRVAALLRDGAAPGRIVVAAHGIAELAPELMISLRRAGVPARTREAASLAETATYRLACDLALMNEHAEVTRERVAAIIASSLVDLRFLDSGAPPPQVMARHLRMAAVRSRSADPGGDDGFAGRLSRLAAAQIRTGHLKDASLVPRTAAVVRKLFSLIDRWPQTATWVEHGEALLGLLQQLGVPDRLEDLSFARQPLPSARPALSDVMQSEGLAREQAAWAHLCDAVNNLRVSIEVLRLSGQQVSKAEFVAWLEQQCAESSTAQTEVSGAFVELVELEELAGRQIDHLFIIGAYDGRLPESAEPDSVLADDERWQLNNVLGRPVFRVAPAGASTSVLPARQLLQTLALALAVEAPQRSLTITRPRLDGRGRPLAPSPLLPIMVSGTEAEHLPFVAVDPSLAARSTPSIEERRQAAIERMQVFRGTRLPGKYSGNVTALAETLPHVAPGRQERPWSASALERVANCSFRYLAEWMWRAHEEDEPVDQVGPLEQGRLAHLAAEYAVREIVSHGLWKVGCIPEALEAGLAAASKALDEQEPATVLGHPDLWAVTRERMLARLRRLLDLEIRYTCSIGVTPMAYELAFGLPMAELPAVEISGVFVAGQVDRVDLGPDMVTILDYKSGRTEANARKYADEALLETQFQLPLYVAALGRVLPQAQGRLVDAGYISLRDAQRTILLSEALSAKNIRDVTPALENALKSVVTRVRSGDFAVAPRSCSGCHLRPVCRIPRPEDRS